MFRMEWYVTIYFATTISGVICVNGKRALFPTKSRLRVAPNLGERQTSGRNTLAVRDSEDTRKTLGGHATGSAENSHSHSHSLHQIS